MVKKHLPARKESMENTPLIEQKYQTLRKILSFFGRIAVAFSGGVDSTFLLDAISEEVGRENTLAVIAPSFLVPLGETKQAQKIAIDFGVPFLLIDFDPFLIPEFAQNHPDRCYWCKKTLFQAIQGVANSQDISTVVDGSNIDDEQDYRPGMKALEELGVQSPLRKAGLTKTDIRTLSRQHGLSTWNQPSSPCLATRIPFGTPVTREKLTRIENAEAVLHHLGFPVCRVRDHDTIARIEIPSEQITDCFSPAIRHIISDHLKQLGYLYVALELGGFVSGNMNKTVLKGYE
ncbi:MAG: ATP-dependent sacrificial sulfur transferase LarE [Atribacterota bacterium]